MDSWLPKVNIYVNAKASDWLAEVGRNSPFGNTNFERSVLPPYGTVYLNHLIGEFESLRGRPGNDCACKLGQEIVDRANKAGTITWGDAYVLERSVMVMLPDEEVHQRIWCLEARYRDAQGNTAAYDSFLKLDAAHLSPEDIKHGRARLDNLIRELYRLYTITACREKMRSKLSKHALIIAVIMFVVAIGIVGLLRRVDSALVPFAIVFAAGAIGGAISYERRVQSLPTGGESLGDLVMLSVGSGLFLSPIAGGLFAIVLYLLFAAGLAEGAVFPKLGEPNAPIRSLTEFALMIRPATTSAWAQLLIWSFVAGFAERFVPDTLDRLIAKSEEKKKHSS